MRPLHFRALVLETTDQCNARCSMCYQAAGPRGSELRGDERLALDVIFKVIDEAAQLDGLDSRIHVSGGEAFLRYDDTLATFRHAKAAGFFNIGSTTNGFWAVTRERALECCEELMDAGVDYLELSMDSWHLPYIPLLRIHNLLWAARRTGIAIILRTLTTKSQQLPALLDGFSDCELLGSLVANGRVIPVGRAAMQVDSDDIFWGPGPIGNCEDLLNLTVSPNGNVYPCCAGADMTESLSSGNVNHEPLSDIVFKMKTDRTIREIIHSGTGSLIPIVKELGFEACLKKHYDSICHLCWDLFKDPEVAAALRSHFVEAQVHEMIQTLNIDRSQ